jgi:tetratricopeptide (TPR) repeat protein
LTNGVRGGVSRNLQPRPARLKDDPKALARAEQAVALDDRFARAYYARGLLLQRRSRLEEAIRDLGRAVDLEPAMNLARFHLAQAWILRGDIRRGEALASEVSAACKNPGLRARLEDRLNEVLARVRERVQARQAGSEQD